MILLTDISLVTTPDGQEHYWRSSSMDDLWDSTQQKVDSFLDFSVVWSVNKHRWYLQLSVYNNFARAWMGNSSIKTNATNCVQVLQHEARPRSSFNLVQDDKRA